MNKRSKLFAFISAGNIGAAGLLASVCAMAAADLQFGWDAATNAALYEFRLFTSNQWRYAGLAATAPDTEGWLRGLTNGQHVVGVVAVGTNDLSSDISNSVTVMVQRVIINMEYATNLLATNWSTAARFTNQIAVVTNQLFYRARLQLQ